MKSFLGAVVYYRRFIERTHNWTFLLAPSTGGKAPGTVEWTPDMLTTFTHSCESLCNHHVELNVPSNSDYFELHTNASRLGLGAVFNIVRGIERRPVAFYSKQLQGAEKGYSATEREALAILKAVKLFYHHFVYGTDFIVLLTINLYPVK